MLLPGWALFTVCAIVGAAGLVAAYRKPWTNALAFLTVLNISAVSIVQFSDPLGLPVGERRTAETWAYVAALFRSSVVGLTIIGWLAARLAAHREQTGNPLSGPIFINQSGNALDLNNLLGRVILPALNVCGICSKPESEHSQANHEYERNSVLPQWHGWHAFRRGLATNLHPMGVDDLTIQAVRGTRTSA